MEHQVHLMWFAHLKMVLWFGATYVNIDAYASTLLRSWYISHHQVRILLSCISNALEFSTIWSTWGSVLEFSLHHLQYHTISKSWGSPYLSTLIVCNYHEPNCIWPTLCIRMAICLLVRMENQRTIICEDPHLDITWKCIIHYE